MKLKPYLFLGTLVMILVFVLGVRYGQKVEKTNKVINYVLSLPPTKPPSPTNQPLEFKSFVSKDCGLSFLYPSTLGLEKESSIGAILEEKGKPVIIVNCTQENNIAGVLREKKTATTEIKIDYKNIIAKLKNDQLFFKLRNPWTGREIFIAIDKNLIPLFEKTLAFIELYNQP